MKIGVDVVSGESNHLDLIHGCVDALKAADDVEVVLIGSKQNYEKLLSHSSFNFFHKNASLHSRLSFLDVPDVITMEDAPTPGILKSKKDSSIIQGLRAHKDGKLDAFFSPGNTGVIVLAASLIMGRVKGVKKPALMAFMPNRESGANILLDVGASRECEVENLIRYGIIGTVYSSQLLGVENPRVGILNIGSESHKGTELMKNTYTRMKDMDFNFAGNVEGRDLFEDKADVIVCDGTVGNIALKVAEGAGSVIDVMLKKSIKSSLSAILSLPFYKGALKNLKSLMDPERFGGAPLVGVNGNVFIGHGASGRMAFQSAILAAKRAVENGILERINRQLEQYHLS